MNFLPPTFYTTTSAAQPTTATAQATITPSSSSTRGAYKSSLEALIQQQPLDQSSQQQDQVQRQHDHSHHQTQPTSQSQSESMSDGHTNPSQPQSQPQPQPQSQLPPPPSAEPHPQAPPHHQQNPPLMNLPSVPPPPAQPPPAPPGSVPQQPSQEWSQFVFPPQHGPSMVSPVPTAASTTPGSTPSSSSSAYYRRHQRHHSASRGLSSVPISRSNSLTRGRRHPYYPQYYHQRSSSMGGTPYTVDPDGLIVAMRKQGRSWSEIAAAVRMDEYGVQVRYHRAMSTQPTSSSPYVSQEPVYWEKEDIDCLHELLEIGERAKWKYIATELTRERNKRMTAVACQKKFKEMFGVAEASSVLGSSLCYVVSANGWASLDMARQPNLSSSSTLTQTPNPNTGDPSNYGYESPREM